MTLFLKYSCTILFDSLFLVPPFPMMLSNLLHEQIDSHRGLFHILQVGMATNIPPHNLGELVDVLCALIHNPEATVSSQKFIP